MFFNRKHQSMLYVIVCVCWLATAEAEGPNPNYDAIAKVFAEQYYAIFGNENVHTRIAALSEQYHTAESLAVFEGKSLQGQADITLALAHLAQTNPKYVVTKLTALPLQDGSILVSLIGHWRPDEQPTQLYSQEFVLRQGDNSFYVEREIFQTIPEHD